MAALSVLQTEAITRGYGANLDTVLTGPIIHIDPDVSTSGDGLSPESPLKSWSEVDFGISAKNFVQKAGTTDVLCNDLTLRPPSDGYYFGSYGLGAKPVIVKQNITSTSYATSLFNLNSRQNVRFENIGFDLTNSAGIRFESSWQDASGLRVIDCDFRLNSTGLLLRPDGRTLDEVKGIYLYASTRYAHKDCVIAGCTFTSGDPVTHFTVNGWKTIGIYGLFYQTITGLTVRNCRFFNLTGDGLDFFVERDKISELDIPTGIMINDNHFEKVYGSPLNNRFGMKSVAGHESAILRNSFINVGHPAIGGVNCIQGQNMHDLEIAYNYIDGVTTSAPDGAGIILDWAVGSFEHMSKNCKVHHNKIRRCRSLGSHAAAGISIYVAQGSMVYANDIFDCESGVALGKRQNTGTKVFNNTVRNCDQAFYVGDYPDNVGSSLSLLANNIARDCRLVVRSSNSSVVAKSRNNYFFNCCAISNDGSYKAYIKYPDHVGDDIVDIDPLAADVSSENRWVLENLSPCIGAGALLDEYAEVETSSFGLNGVPLSNSPTVGAWQPE